jgi:hypothetical protein
VLTPLRSGLAKDRAWHAPAAHRSGCRRPFRWATLWQRPHDGLRRAALLTLSAGTLFVLINALYQTSRREAVPADAVTTVQFKKGQPEDPVPALRPLADAAPAAMEAESLDQDARARNEGIVLENPPVPLPVPPAAEPRLPKLRNLPAEPAAAPAKEKALAAEPSEPEPEQKPYKRERAKPSAIERPPPGLQIKPSLLAGAPLEHPAQRPLNAIPTNTAPAKAPRQP